MNLFKKLTFLSIISASFVFGLFAYSHISASAQETGYDVTVTPTFQDLSVNPGESVSDRVTIRNNTNSTITIAVDVKKLTGDETGQLTISEDNSDDSLSWFVFEQDTYELPPLEDVDIPFTIEVPEEAAYGYYYTINFTDTDVEQGSTGAAIAGAAAVPVLLNVRSDDAVSEVKLVNFSTSEYVNEYLPVNFKVELENTGNVHVRPVGNIFLSGNGQKEVDQILVNEGNGAIIPNSVRIFEPAWTNGFIVRETTSVDGVESTNLKINWNQLTDFRFGKYTADLVVVYNNGERDIAIDESISFWVIPWKVIVGGIVAIIIIILIVRWILKRYISREVKKRTK